VVVVFVGVCDRDSEVCLSNAFQNVLQLCKVHHMHVTIHVRAIYLVTS